MNFTSVDGVPVLWTVWELETGCGNCETGTATCVIIASYSPWATGDPDDDLQAARRTCQACGGRLRAEMELIAEIRVEIAMREKRAIKTRREKALYGPPRNQKPIILFDPDAFHQPTLFSLEWLQGLPGC